MRIDARDNNVRTGITRAQKLRENRQKRAYARILRPVLLSYSHNYDILAI